MSEKRKSWLQEMAEANRRAQVASPREDYVERVEKQDVAFTTVVPAPPVSPAPGQERALAKWEAKAPAPQARPGAPSSTPRVRAWRARNPDVWRQRHAAYMKSWRAKKAQAKSSAPE